MDNYSMFSDDEIEKIANMTAGGIVSLSNKQVLNIAYEMENQGFKKTDTEALKTISFFRVDVLRSINHNSLNRYNKLHKSKYSTIGWQVGTVKDILKKYNATKDIQKVQDDVTKYIKDKEIREIADDIAYDLKLKDLASQSEESEPSTNELTPKVKKLSLKRKRKNNNDGLEQ